MRKLFITVFITTLLLLLSNLFDVNSLVLSSEVKSDRIIVKFKPLVPDILKNKAVEKYGLKLDERLLLKDSFVIKVPGGRSGEFISNFRKNIFIDFAEEDYKAEKLDIPDDPLFSEQWGLENINASEAWDINHGLDNIDIAIVDTGINYTHPDLKSKIIVSVNCIYSSCSNYQTTDPDGHGTHVAGIASAITNNSQGIAGVSWGANLMSVKVLDDNGSGYYSGIANGIVWAVDNGAEVINLSLGGKYSSYVLKNAIDYAWSKGVLIVAAAGNDASTRPIYPAYYSNVIAVAAVDEKDSKAYFSSFGSWVDVAAPGVSIISTYRNSYSNLSGTSMATPHVSGLASLVWSNNRSLTNSQVRKIIEESSDKITGSGSYWNWGRINACNAMSCGDTGEITPTPVLPTATPTSTPTPTPILIPTAIPTSTPTPTSIPPTPTFTPTPTPSPTPSSNPLPWWCKYIPQHHTCN